MPANVIGDKVQKRLINRQVEHHLGTHDITQISHFPDGQGIRKVLGLKKIVLFVARHSKDPEADCKQGSGLYPNQQASGGAAP